MPLFKELEISAKTPGPGVIPKINIASANVIMLSYDMVFPF